MNKCQKCGIYGIERDLCPMCAKYGDRILIFSNNLNNKHVIGCKKCVGCNDWYFRSGDIHFPIEHKHCKGLIHLDKDILSDEYSCNINLIFKCERCEERLDIWTEGELIDEEFKNVFEDEK